MKLNENYNIILITSTPSGTARTFHNVNIVKCVTEYNIWVISYDKLEIIKYMYTHFNYYGYIYIQDISLYEEH